VALAGPALVPIALPAIVIPAISLPVPRALPSGAGGASVSPPPPPAPAPVRNSAPPPPVRAGSSDAGPASTFRAGYPPYLRSAGIGQVASIALPGFVGILLLTGAGGLIGYRQARTGRALRAGGVERFVG
jgi:hypothetical protein